jgi:hypothetical protein
MRVSRKLFLVVLLFALCGSTFAQTSANADANRKWTAFWHQFSAAIKKKNLEVIRKTIPADFFDGGGGMSPTEWLNYIKENERNGSWRDIQRSMARGTVPAKPNSPGTPTRITRDNGYYFEFRNGRWYFAGVMGD